MTNRCERGRVRGEWFAENLEARNLPTAGAAGIADVFCELGPVSRPAALAGVAATAEVEAGAAVTFRFEIEAGGEYTLLVRHTGEGLALQATGPAGPIMIHASLTGPQQAIALRMPRGTYEVTASAVGGQSVFVDWELLLANGVGQTTASSPFSILRRVYPTAQSSAATTGTGTGVGSSSVAAAPAPATSAAVPFALAPGQDQGRISYPYIAGTPIGRAAPSSSSEPTAAVHSLTPLETAFPIAAQPGGGAIPTESAAPQETIDLEILSRPAICELAADPLVAGSPANLDPVRSATGLGTDEPAGERISLLAISPGLVCGGLALAVVSRRRSKGKPALLTHHRSTTPGGPAPNSSMSNLRAFLKRS